MLLKVGCNHTVQCKAKLHPSGCICHEVSLNIGQAPPGKPWRVHRILHWADRGRQSGCPSQPRHLVVQHTGSSRSAYHVFAGCQAADVMLTVIEVAVRALVAGVPSAAGFE